MKETLIEIEKKMPLFVFDLSDRTDVLQSASNAVMEMYQKNPEPRKSNVSAHFVSSFLSHTENHNFSPLIELTLECVSQIAESEYGRETKFECMNCWGAIYRPGDSARSHHHFPYDFAAVCYLSVDEGAAPIVFEESYELQPKVGTLVLFSGLLSHHVPPTSSGRTVVGMNLNKRPEPWWPIDPDRK
jgi:hypothetical protein